MLDATPEDVIRSGDPAFGTYAGRCPDVEGVGVAEEHLARW